MLFNNLKEKFSNNFKNSWYRQNVIVIGICLFLVFSFSIGYSILLQNLDIKGGVLLSNNEDIKIIDISLKDSNSCGYSLFNPKIEENSITVGVTLPEIDCFLEYSVTISNQTTDNKLLKNINNLAYDNEDIVYELAGLEIKQVFKPMEEITFDIRIFYNSDLEIIPNYKDIKAIFDFEFSDYYPPAVDILYSTTDWTNKNVLATISFDKNGVDILNNEGLNSYTFLKNGEFVFEFIDEEGVIGSAIVTVSWIDLVSPKILDVTSLIEEAFLYLKVLVMDDSGVNKYYYSIDNGVTWIESKDGSYTINMNEEVIDNIKVKVVDKAGNETIEEVKY